MAQHQLQIPHFRLKIGGQNLPAEVLADIQWVEYEDKVNTPAMFAFGLSILDFEKGAWNHLDLQQFTLGIEVTLFMGMDSEVKMLDGEITSLEPTFGGELSQLEVRGYDHLHRLRFGEKQRTFSKRKDSDIARLMAQNWGLKSKAQRTSTTYPYLAQNNQSDYEFLLHRARRIGYELWAKEKTLYFQPSREGEGAAFTLQYPGDLEEFSARLSARYQGNETKVRGWDVKKKKVIKADADAKKNSPSMGAKASGAEITQKGFKSSSSSIINEPVLDSQEAKDLARAHLESHLIKSLEGEGLALGNPEIKAGKTVKIEGLGQRFSGPYYITKTRHLWDERGYETRFKVRRTGV